MFSPNRVRFPHKQYWTYACCFGTLWQYVQLCRSCSTSVGCPTLRDVELPFVTLVCSASACPHLLRTTKTLSLERGVVLPPEVELCEHVSPVYQKKVSSWRFPVSWRVLLGLRPQTGISRGCQHLPVLLQVAQTEAYASSLLHNSPAAHSEAEVFDGSVLATTVLPLLGEKMRSMRASTVPKSTQVVVVVASSGGRPCL